VSEDRLSGVARVPFTGSGYRFVGNELTVVSTCLLDNILMGEFNVVGEHDDGDKRSIPRFSCITNDLAKQRPNVENDDSVVYTLVRICRISSLPCTALEPLVHIFYPLLS
jgi:hypothetical protein